MMTGAAAGSSAASVATAAAAGKIDVGIKKDRNQNKTQKLSLLPFSPDGFWRSMAPRTFIH